MLQGPDRAAPGLRLNSHFKTKRGWLHCPNKGQYRHAEDTKDLLEMQIFEREVRLDDASCLHSRSQHILLRRHVVCRRYAGKITQIATNQTEIIA